MLHVSWKKSDKPPFWTKERRHESVKVFWCLMALVNLVFVGLSCETPGASTPFYIGMWGCIIILNLEIIKDKIK